jgi:hypothetical protein
MMNIHADLSGLLFLAGRWRGDGHGTYPTIEPFDYTEEIDLLPGPGKPFLAYTQRTWRRGSGDPLHSEAGYLRVIGVDALELVIAQPTGIVEIHTGNLAGHSLHFEGRAFATPAARDVTATTRTITVTGDRLDYTFSMEAVGQPLTHHLAASLTRLPD